MKIFGFFYSEKIIFHQNIKGYQHSLLGMTTKGLRWGGPIPTRLVYFFFILKPVLFKKLNWMGRGRVDRDEKFSKPAPFTFVFIFYFFIFLFFIFYFYYIKIIRFYKKIKIL